MPDLDLLSALPSDGIPAVPRRSIVPLLVAVALILAGVKLGILYAAHIQETKDTRVAVERLREDVNARFCRLEAAAHLAEWPTCYRSTTTAGRSP